MKLNNKKSINTYSIVGYDPATREHGIAVASKFLAVGAIVPWAKAGVGAVATQSWANTDFGTKGLELIAEGKSAQEAMNMILSEDEGKSTRQVGMVDANGMSITFSGDECHPWAGGISGPNYAIQGNILVDERTVQAMETAFLTTSGPLSERLLAALLAGENTGGDSRGKQSAALLVVKERSGYGGKTDKYIDLRVDDHKEPVHELIRIHQLHQLYFQKSNAEDIVVIDAKLQQKISDILITLGYLHESDRESKELFDEKLKEFQLIENFDERIQEPGKVDLKVVSFMEGLFKKITDKVFKN